MRSKIVVGRLIAVAFLMGGFLSEGTSLLGQGSATTLQPLFSAATGEPLAPEAVSPISEPKPDLVSPDGKWRFWYGGGNLFAKEINSEERIELLRHQSKRQNIQMRQFQWSPDSKHLLFIHSDSKDVRRRSVLVPGDPSYPKHSSHRFARVGGEIPQLKVGVATLETGEVKWLPIEMPEEGFYLGQLEWAGNSNEVLVEWLSRFRNRREFLLVPVDGEPKTIFSETSDAWVVASQAKNLGLIWIENEQKCIIIHEQDGWRHAYLYSRDGQQIALLTPGDYRTTPRRSIFSECHWTGRAVESKSRLPINQEPTVMTSPQMPSPPFIPTLQSIVLQSLNWWNCRAIAL